MTGSPRIEAFVSEVAAALPGPARARDDIIAELRSGLLDATDAYRAAGRPPGDAAAAAAAEFGDPRQVAAAFRPELAARQAHRLALTLVTTGPRTAPAAAAIAGFGAAAADLAVFILLTSKLASTPAALAPAPALAAATASLARLTLAGRAARHCLAARAALS